MKNVGSLDRLLRLAAATAIMAAIAMGLIGGTFAIVLTVIAAILLLTGLTSTCPVYLPFGFSTRRTTR